MGVVFGNKWWGSLKYRIKDFAIKYDCQLRLERAKRTKALDFPGCREGNSFAVGLV